jgi:ribosomal protein L32
MRHNRSQTASRRSHHALKNLRLSVTKEGTVHPRHRVLLDGSTYRGRTVMDTSSKRMVRAQKAKKAREMTDGPQQETQAEEKPEKKEKKEKKSK